MGKTDHSSSYIINPDYNMNSSQITIDLTDVTDNFTVEAIVSIGNLSIRRFQTIPIVTNEIRCDAFYYTFGTPLMQLENNIDNENTLNSDILKATYYARTRPVNFLGFTNLPGQRLENYTARPQLQIRILYMIYNMRARYVYLLKNRNLNYKADRRMYIAF